MLGIALLVVAVLDFNAAASEMERAVIEGDEATLLRLSDQFRNALDSDPADREVRLPYAVAYVSWRLAFFHERGSKPYENLLKSAERELKRILDANPNDAEAQALYGTVNGWLITGAWSAIRRGPRADKAYRRAREIAPENPRAVMHQGLSRLFRPTAFGGGVDKAEAELSLALKLFDEEARDKPWPNGGHAEIQAWMGQLMEKKGEFDRARAYYDKALEQEPNYRWVREELLPALEAEEAKRSTP